MFMFQKRKCTQETVGTVIKKRWNGEVWFLTAEYIVDQKTYKKTEQMRYQKIKTYKIMNLPIGVKSQAPLGKLEKGDPVRIRYNPQNPKKSYMPDNEGLRLV